MDHQYVKKYLVLLFIATLLFGCFSKPTVTINEKKLTLEIVTTESTRSLGLMHRTTLPDNHGMLFAYPHPHPLSFWMKNTLIPLSIAFIDERHQIVSIQKMNPEPGPYYKHYKSPILVPLALEVPQGWFEHHGIHEGDVVEFSRSAKSAIRKAE
ncbi:DUF192 domain-containing protein [Bdellovibrionota bacterium]